MPENVVLLYIEGEPWTLGAVCLVLAVLCLILWASLLPYFARRCGTVRRMTTEEAQQRAVLGQGRHYEPGRILVAGPAVGKKWEVEFTIGSLRELREQGSPLWLLLPVFTGLLATTAIFLFGLGAALLTQEWILLSFCGGALLLSAIIVFMVWAAVYTKLN